MKQSDSETESPIPYKYKDADNKVYKDIVLKNDKGELSEDVSQDQSVISKKNKKNKNVNLDELTDEEIQDLITEKIQYIQKIGNKNQSLQRKLNSALKKLNEKILISSEMLYKKETNSTELQWLKDQLENKKNILNTEKRINHSYKVQYNILENKLKARNNRKESKKNIENDNNNNISVSQTLKKTHSTKSLSINKTTQVSSSLYMSIEDEINKIKNENKELITKINDIKKTIDKNLEEDGIKINNEKKYKKITDLIKKTKIIEIKKEKNENNRSFDDNISNNQLKYLLTEKLTKDDITIETNLNEENETFKNNNFNSTINETTKLAQKILNLNSYQKNKAKDKIKIKHLLLKSKIGNNERNPKVLGCIRNNKIRSKRRFIDTSVSFDRSRGLTEDKINKKKNDKNIKPINHGNEKRRKVILKMKKTIKII